MIIYDDDGIGYKVVPMSVIEDIKAEIYKTLDEYEPACESQNNFDGGLIVALEIIDRHIGERSRNENR